MTCIEILSPKKAKDEGGSGLLCSTSLKGEPEAKDCMQIKHQLCEQ